MSTRDVAPGTIEALEAAAAGRHPDVVHIIRYFAWAQLAPVQQPIAKRVAQLALSMVEVLPDGPDLVAGLRLLSEAQDRFVGAVK